MTELAPDLKGQASLTLGDVIVQTRDNFPDPRFRPQVHLDTSQYHIYGIDPSPFQIWVTADGGGTKADLMERLREFWVLPHDAIAMAESDDARFGRFTIGAAEILDTNTAKDEEVVSQIGYGLKEACDVGGFPLLNGETAELGYRSSGWGETHVNMNVVTVSLINHDKLILGDRLRPRQPVIAIREKGIRSNGLTKARTILEADYLYRHGYMSKQSYIADRLGIHATEQRYGGAIGHNFMEQVLLPWHEDHPKIVKQLFIPSILHSRLMYAAQGGVDGEKVIDIMGAAHISGGGVPEKGKRLVEVTGLGLHIDPPFPEPEGIQSLLDLARELPNEGTHLIDDRTACQQWNRGIGFMVVTETTNHADEFVKLAESMGYEAAIAGEVTDRKGIEFHGHTWTY